MYQHFNSIVVNIEYRGPHFEKMAASFLFSVQWRRCISRVEAWRNVAGMGSWVVTGALLCGNRKAVQLYMHSFSQPINVRRRSRINSCWVPKKMRQQSSDQSTGGQRRGFHFATLTPHFYSISFYLSRWR